MQRHRGLRANRDLGIILGVVLAVTLPFADKAIHIDDVYFVEVARNILAHPWRPFAGAVALEDEDYRVFAAQGRCPDTFASMSHPPLVPYAIALIAAVTGGWRERWLHLGFALFAGGAALAMYSLARRFTRHGLAATLLLISSPIFILSAQSLMTDMPTLAFSLGGLALLVQGLDQERRGKVVAAGVLVGLAVVTRYAALLSVPLLLAYGLARGRLRRARPALAGVGVVLAGWCLQNLASEGQLHILASARHYRLFYAEHSFDGVGLVKKSLGDLSGLGGTTFLAAALVVLAGAERQVIAFALGALGAAAVFVVQPAGMERLETYSTVDVMAVAACVGCAVALLTEALWSARKPAAVPAEPAVVAGSDAPFLIAWLLLALTGSLLFLPFGTARYMLGVLPPLWLLLVRGAESRLGARPVLSVAFGLAVAQGLLLGGVLSLADAEQADRYRKVAASTRQSYPDRTVWFVGEWGFRYYMGEVGGRYLRSADDAPQPGDIIVRPFLAGMHAMSANVRRRAVLLQEIPLQSRWPIRLMSFDAHAGYYSHHWGYLPWAFSHAPLERIEIFEVRAPAGIPIAAATCASS